MLKPNQKRIDKGMWWDRAWSIVEGCTPVSPACKNCWSASATAMRACQNKNPKIIKRYEGLIVPGSRPPKFNGTIRPMWDDLNKPTPRQKPAVWAIWNDLFHKDVPFEFIYKALERMLICNQHFFIVCTKRPERMAGMMPDVWFHLGRNYSLEREFTGDYFFPLKNVMAMTTTENQEQADIRIPHLLRADFAWRGLSVEPMLSKIDLSRWAHRTLGYDQQDEVFRCRECGNTGHGSYFSVPTGGDDYTCNCTECGASAEDDETDTIGNIDFVACGPETGPKARPCDPKWISDLYEQCKAAGVPFFDKSKNCLARESPG